MVVQVTGPQMTILFTTNTTTIVNTSISIITATVIITSSIGTVTVTNIITTAGGTSARRAARRRDRRWAPGRPTGPPAPQSVPALLRE